MKKFLEEFKSFALRGNVMDMAVGVLIGGAFSGIVTSLTDNFIQPIIKLVMTGKVYTLEEISGYASAFGSCIFKNHSTDKCPNHASRKRKQASCAVQNAIETPYTGPRNTAASTLHKCWIGKHLLGPIGIENDDKITATATNIADIVNFFNFI